MMCSNILMTNIIYNVPLGVDDMLKYSKISLLFLNLVCCILFLVPTISLLKTTKGLS